MNSMICKHNLYNCIVSISKQIYSHIGPNSTLQKKFYVLMQSVSTHCKEIHIFYKVKGGKVCL